MSGKLDFSVLDNPDNRSNRRWEGRDENRQRQMSVRMKEGVYDKFRELCSRERRTNGDMLERMMLAYLSQKEKGKLPPELED